MSERRRYRFGPLEPGSALGGLRWGQVGVLAGGLVGMVLALHAAPGPAGGALALALAGAGAAVAFVPVAGRTPEAWAAVAAGFAGRRLTGRHRYRTPAPTLGRRAGDARPSAPPETLGALEILAHPVGGGQIGVLADGPAYTGLLAVEGAAFALLDPADQERRVAAWGTLLAGLCRAGNPVCRLQWLERTASQPVGELGRYLAEGLALPRGHQSVRSYLDLVDEAGPAARQHELLLAVQVDTRRAARAAPRGGGRGGALAVLERELAALAQRLLAAEVPVQGALTPRMLARALRLGYDPDARAGLDRASVADPARAGVDPASAGPAAAEEGWGAYRTDGAWHTTYWVAEWPRVEVGADFLAPLLLHSAVRRTVSVVMEPLDPGAALRRAESARTNEASDQELRARMGFMGTARRRRQHESLAAREQEVADGHGSFRYAGYVTVSAASPEGLEAAAADVEQAAQMARLELRRLWGEQAAAFTYTLPLGRGLR